MRQFGGLHHFKGWNKPILTDSSGFQVWSLGEMRKISEEGVRFASPVNGDKLFLTPEVSMQIQTVLNSDIVMQFDECTPYDVKGHITTEAEASPQARCLCSYLAGSRHIAPASCWCTSTPAGNPSGGSQTAFAGLQLQTLP
jgi:tRNA-guanine family transglycosylase